MREGKQEESPLSQIDRGPININAPDSDFPRFEFEITLKYNTPGFPTDGSLSQIEPVHLQGTSTNHNRS